MKIPFTLDAWLKDKSQKIETRNGRPVHYIGLDRAGWQVFEVFRKNGTSEYRTYHDSYLYSGPRESTFDLFIVTPEEELTEFETALMEFVNAREPKNPMTLEGAKNNGSILLNIAREQFIKDGYVIEKKAFHDAVEKVAPEVMKEVFDKVDTEEALRLGYEKGRADALKDLPRWERITLREDTSFLGCRNEDELFHKGRVIALSELEKLPGFNE